MESSDLSSFFVRSEQNLHDARLNTSLSGTNLERAGDYNQRIVLQAIRIARETTRQQLSRITGLTAPAIANIIRRLKEADFVCTAGRLQGKRGQPAMQIQINPDGAFGIGINIDRDHITMVSVDLAGEIRSRFSREVSFALPAEVLGLVEQALPTLLQQGNINRSRILGIGIAIPDDLGRIDFPHRPERYNEWDSVDLTKLLEEALPWPVHIDNDAAAAALGESQLGASINLSSFFYVLVSAGLGGGLVIDRKHFRGADGRSGEIWAMPDHSKEKSCVQDTVSLSALYARLEQIGVVPQSPEELLTVKDDAKRIIDAWLEDSAVALVYPLIAINCLINPGAILVGGRLPEALADALVERLEHVMAKCDLPSAAPIRRAVAAKDAPAVGAAVIPFLATVLPSEGILMQAGRQ